jgi:hypothetical protein
LVGDLLLNQLGLEFGGVVRGLDLLVLLGADRILVEQNGRGVVVRLRDRFLVWVIASSSMRRLSSRDRFTQSLFAGLAALFWHVASAYLAVFRAEAADLLNSCSVRL